MTERNANSAWRDSSQRVGFLLSQVGAFAAARFANRLAEIGLQPSDIGIMRMIATNSDISQQSLAGLLGVGPSRVVALIDELERRSLVSRERSRKDRRSHELRLTEDGQAVMMRMRDIGAAHEEDIVGALNADERQSLAALLAKIALSHNLTPDVHPGYRKLAAPADAPRQADR